MQPLPEDFLRREGYEKDLTKGQMKAFIARFSQDDGHNKLPSEQKVSEMLGISPRALRARFTEIYKKYRIQPGGPGQFSRLYQYLRHRIIETGFEKHKPYPLALQMPPLPGHFVERPQHQQAVKELLFCSDPAIPGTLVVSAIYGPQGIGKSVLAASLGHDLDVQARFLDGVLWVTLGQSPDILSALSGWIRVLKDTEFQPATVENAAAHLRTLLYSKQILLIVDDVWNPSHLEPFRVGQGRSRLLITARSAKIADAQRYDLDRLSPQEALELLTKLLGKALMPDAQEAIAFAKRVNFVPQALEKGAAQVKDGMTWKELMEELE